MADEKPITFSCAATLDFPPERIADAILELGRWPEFLGYGVLPGIRAAEFEVRTPEVVGTRIRVANADGSSHVEQIVEWNPDRRVRLRMGEFSSPLSLLATAFEETWDFERTGQATWVVRSFELHPRTRAARPFLWLISILLRRAIARHLRQMGEDAERRREGWAEPSTPRSGPSARSAPVNRSTGESG
jgi:hypothetical protein